METRLAEPHPSDLPDLALLFGVCLVLLGLLAISFSLLSTLMTALLLGLVLVVDGAMAAFQARTRRRAWVGLLQFLLGVLAVVIGIAFVVWPLTSLRVVTPLLLALLLADGVLVIASSLEGRVQIPELVVGGVTFALGIALAIWGHTIDMWLAGAIAGVFLINRGALFMAASIRTRASRGRAAHVGQ